MSVCHTYISLFILCPQKTFLQSIPGKSRLIIQGRISYSYLDTLCMSCCKTQTLEKLNIFDPMATLQKIYLVMFRISEG